MTLRRQSGGFFLTPTKLFDGLSRRGFLAGAGAVGISPNIALASGDDDALLKIFDTPLAVIAEFRRHGCDAPLQLVVAKSYWGDPTAKPPPRFSVRPTKKAGTELTTLTIEGATFGNVSSVGAILTFEPRNVDCRVGLVMQNWPRPGPTDFGWVDLQEFLRGAEQSHHELATASVARFVAELKHAETEFLLKSAFGSAIVANLKTATARLSLGGDWRWTIDGGPKPDAFKAFFGLTGDPGKAAAHFNSMSFGPTEVTKGVFDQQILQRAFQDGVSATKGAFCGVAESHPHDCPEGNVMITGDLLLGRHGEMGKGGLQVIGSAFVRDMSLAFQNFGDPERTVSGMLGDTSVRVVTGTHSEGPIRCERALIVRYRSDGLQRLFARMPLIRSAQCIDTNHGAFVVEALDDEVEHPGEDKRREGLIVTATLNAAGQSIESFELRALLHQSTVHFDIASDTSDANNLNVFHRMDFVGASCTFELAPLARSGRPKSDATILLGYEPNKVAAVRESPPVRIGLDQATFRVTRPADLLHLKFRFVGLRLEATGQRVVVKSSQESACDAFQFRDSVRARRAREEADADIIIDRRPLLVVEFPPQHVAERAYFRQVIEAEDAPDIVLDEMSLRSLSRELELLDRFAGGEPYSMQARIEARMAIRKAKQSTATADLASQEPAKQQRARNFLKVAERLDDAYSFEFDALCWPRDQTIYIGPDWLDVDVRRYVQKLLSDEAAKQNSLAGIAGRLPEEDRRGGDYKLWLEAYERLGVAIFGASLPQYCGPQTILEMIELRLWSEADVKRLLDAIDCEQQQNEAFLSDPAEARLSGPSRLVFHFNCAENIEASLDNGLPFTLETLTDWARHDLAVVRRAQKLFAYDSAGKLPARWARNEIIDPIQLLRFQGQTSASGIRKLLDGGLAQPAHRLSEVYAAAAPMPSALETAIEMPFRLFLSPAQDARWRTPRGSVGGGGPIPLWQASLEDDASRASLRAVWSPDFEPSVFRDHAPPPLAGPWAPWSLDRNSDDAGSSTQPERFRTSMDALDRHEIVTLSSIWGLPVGGRREAQKNITLDADQIEPPLGYGIKGGDGDAIYVPRPLQVSEIALSSLGGSLDLDTHFVPQAAPDWKSSSAPRLFEALSVERWRHRAVLGRDVLVEVVYKGFLFPLGHRASLVKRTERQFLKSDGRSGPRAYLVQHMFLRVGYPIKNYAAVGQPYEGRRFPARSIEILTRQTPDLLDPMDERPEWQPLAAATKSHDAVPPGEFQELANGAIYFRNAAGNVLRGLCFWPRTARFSGGNVRFEFQIDGDGGSVAMPLIFVNKTATENAETIAALTAYYNAASKKVARTIDHAGAPRRYAPEAKEGEATFETVNWLLRAEGRRPSTAGDATPNPEGKDKVVLRLNDRFDMDPLLRGADQPPFYPMLEQARLRLRQVAKMTGQTAPEAEITYDRSYVVSGYPARGDGKGPESPAVLLAVLRGNSSPTPTLDYGANGQRAGGIARPESVIVALSPTHGPLGGTENSKPQSAPAGSSPASSHDTVSTQAAISGALPDATNMLTSLPDLGALQATLAQFNPSTFFQGAKLLGILDLADVLTAIGGTPKLLEEIEYLSAESWEITKSTILAPLNDILDTFTRTLNDSAYGISGSLAARVEQFYPDVSNAIATLRTSLAKAIAVAEPAPDEQVRIIGDIYGRSRALIVALERLAADPIGPLKKALDDQISAIKNLLDQQVSKLTEAIKKWTIPNLENPFVSNIDLFAILNLPQPTVSSATDSVVIAPLQRLLLQIWSPILVVPPPMPFDGEKVAQALIDALFKVTEDALLEFENSDPDLKKPDFDRQPFETALTEFKNAINSNKEQIKALITSSPAITLIDSADRYVAVVKTAQSGDADTFFKFIHGVVEFLSWTVKVLQPPQLFLKKDKLEEELLKAANSVIAALPDYDEPFFGEAVFRSVQDCLSWSKEQLAEYAHLGDISHPLDELIADLNKLAAVRAAKTLPSSFSDLESEVRMVFEAIREISAGARKVITHAAALSEGIKWNEFSDIESADKRVIGGLAGVACSLALIAGKGTALAKLKQAAEAFSPENNNLPDPSAIAQSVASIDKAGGELYTHLSTALADAKAHLSATDYPLEWVKALSGANPSLAASTKIDDLLRALKDQSFRSLHEVLGSVDEYRTQCTIKMLQWLSFTTATSLKIVTQIAPQLSKLLLFVGNLAGVVQKEARESIAHLTPLTQWLNDPTVNSILGKPLSSISEEFNLNSTTNLIALLGNFSVQKSCDIAIKKFQDTPSVQTSNDVAGCAKDTLSNFYDLRDRAVAIEANFVEVGQALVKGNLARLIDVDAPRRAIERLLRNLIPHKATLTYDFDTQVQPFGGVFLPEPTGGQRLTITSRTEIDLLNGRAPTFSIKGTLDPFAIHLLGGIDVVTVHFKQATFSGGQGSSFGVSVDMQSVTLGSAVAFLKQLQDYLSPKGNGFFLKSAEGFPGVEVGYGLNLGTISLGPVSFINVSLNASCMLPFDRRDALFKISLSRPDSPFLISVGIYGGGGYLALIGNGKQIVGFEASFEFGGVAAFAFGPLSGIGRLTTGIFVRKLYDSATVDGYFFAGGAARIACFGISASLTVRVGQQPGGAMAGSAVFTFSFSLGLAHLDFSVPVWKTQAALGKSAALIPKRPTRYAAAHMSDAPSRREHVSRPQSGMGRTAVNVTSADRNWRKYSEYFDEDLVPVKALK